MIAKKPDKSSGGKENLRRVWLGSIRGGAWGSEGNFVQIGQISFTPALGWDNIVHIETKNDLPNSD